jgi:hypothetical protein
MLSLRSILSQLNDLFGRDKMLRKLSMTDALIVFTTYLPLPTLPYPLRKC